MANQTDPLARQIHGSDPQHLIEKIVRMRIYDSRFWKERCFGLSAETLVDVAVAQLEYVGGTYSHAVKPAPFLCLVLKMLQIQPSEDIVCELVEQPHAKYLRALAAFYARLTMRSAQVHKLLEPLLADRRKLAQRTTTGWMLTHMDELIDELLTGDTCLGIALPRMTARAVLVATGALLPRVSALDAELAAESEGDDEGDGDEEGEKGRVDEQADLSSLAERVEKAEGDGEASPKSKDPLPPSDEATAAAELPAAGVKRPRAGGVGVSGGGWLTQLKQRVGGSDGPVGRGANVAAPAAAVASGAALAPAPDSVEAWNAERARLGLKPLK